MVKKILIGSVIVIFLLIGIHLSWGGRVTKMDGSAPNSLESGK